MSPSRGARTKPEPPANAKVYWQKANRFAHAAEANAKEENWDPAVANAINAVINAVDALCVHYRGLRSASGSHRDALQILDSCIELDSKDREVLRRHLSALLGQKTFAQYDGRLMDAQDAEAALSHMDRALAAAIPIARARGWLA